MHHGPAMTHRRVPVIVLAGGASRRMGMDKRSVLVEGVPMLQRVVDRLAGHPVIIVVDPRRPDPPVMPARSVRVVLDLRPGEGPLAALEAGLTASREPTALVVGADMPWLEPGDPATPGGARHRPAGSQRGMSRGRRSPTAVADALSARAHAASGHPTVGPRRATAASPAGRPGRVPHPGGGMAARGSDRSIRARRRHARRSGMGPMIGPRGARGPQLDRGRHHHRRRPADRRHRHPGRRGAAPDPGVWSRSGAASRSRSRCAPPATRTTLPSDSWSRKVSRCPSDIEGVTLADPATTSRPDDSIVVHLRRPPGHRGGSAERRTVATASCGICGTASIDDIVRRCDPLPEGPLDRAATCCPCCRPACAQAQETFDSTGGLHAIGLFGIGWHPRAGPRGCRSAQRAGQGHRRVGDGRGAAAPRIAPVAQRPRELRARPEGGHGRHPDRWSRSAPRPTWPSRPPAALGMTLVGFLRGDRYNVYSRPDRLGLERVTTERRPARPTARRSAPAGSRRTCGSASGPMVSVSRSPITSARWPAPSGRTGTPCRTRGASCRRVSVTAARWVSLASTTGPSTVSTCARRASTC